MGRVFLGCEELHDTVPPEVVCWMGGLQATALTCDVNGILENKSVRIADYGKCSVLQFSIQTTYAHIQGVYNCQINSPISIA